MAKTADDYFDAANVCEIQEQWTEAIENYDRAIELQPIFPEAYSNRAADWEILENYENAIADYETAIAQSPNDSADYECLARVYLEANDESLVNLKLAVAHARRACELSRFKCFEKLQTLARTCEAAGRHRDAVKYQAKSVELARALQTQDATGVTDPVERINAAIMLPDLESQLSRYRDAAASSRRTPSAWRWVRSRFRKDR